MKLRESTFVMVFALLVFVSFSSAAATPIHIVTYGTAASFERWERIAEAFHEHRPDYQLDVEIVPYAEYITKVSIMVASGVPPDIFMTWAQYKEAWAEQGMLADLGPFWEQSDVARQAEIFPFMMDAAIYHDVIVGVPYDFSTMAIIVNVDALNEAGLAVPDSDWSVEDYRTYAIRLTRPDKGVFGTNQQGTPSPDNWTWAINFTGQGWLNEDRSEVLVDSPGYLNMLNYWLDLVNIGASPRPGQAPPAGDFWSGGFGMWAGWSHWGQRLDNEAFYDWAMVPFPAGQGGNVNFAHGHMWSMPFNAPSPERSWVFLEWLLSPEGQETIVTIDGRQPLSADPELWGAFVSTVRPEKQEIMRRFFIDTLYGQNRIHTMQYWRSWPDVEAVMNRYLQSVFRGEMAPASAMNEAARQMRAILAAD